VEDIGKGSMGEREIRRNGARERGLIVRDFSVF